MGWIGKLSRKPSSPSQFTGYLPPIHNSNLLPCDRRRPKRSRKGSKFCRSVHLQFPTTNQTTTWVKTTPVGGAPEVLEDHTMMNDIVAIGSRTSCNRSNSPQPSSSHVQKTISSEESIQRSEVPQQSAPPPHAGAASANESLIQLLSRDMVHSLLVQETAARAFEVILPSELEDSSNSNDDSLLCPSNLLDSIADRVVQSLQQQLQEGRDSTVGGGQASTDRSLRDMLRKGLAMEDDDDENDDDEDDKDGGGTAATFSASTMFTDDEESQQCEVTNVPTEAAKRLAAGDRWDPDFWYGGNTQQQCRNTAPSRASTAPESTEEPETSDRIVPNASKYTKKGQSHAQPNISRYKFLKGRGYEISSSFDSNNHLEEKNHASILSDITGLTDVSLSLSKAKHLNTTNSTITRKEPVTKSKFVSTPERSQRSERSKESSEKLPMKEASETHRGKSTNVAPPPTASPTAWRAPLSDRRLSNRSDPKVKPSRTTALDSTVAPNYTTKRPSTVRVPSLPSPVAPVSPIKAPPRTSPPIYRKKRVRFSYVHVRHYERILCLNPACSRGPSVGIGWGFVSQEPPATSSGMSLDAWEDARRRIRSPSELLLSRSYREALIREWGYSEREMAAAVRELNKLRSNRRQTVNNLGAQKMEETVEAVFLKVKKLLLLKK